MTPTKEQLKQFVNQLNEATKKEVITIEATPVAELPLTSSKFSGLPYVPKGGSLPTDEQGNSFLMLSQINCEELPENSIYPKKEFFNSGLSMETTSTEWISTTLVAIKESALSIILK